MVPATEKQLSQLGVGPKAEILLVVKFRKYLSLIGALFLLSGCDRTGDQQTVSAKKYDSFWLWAGVKPQPVLDKAQSVYILEAELRASDPSHLRSLRPGIPNVQHAEIWMVIRVETLEFSPVVYAEILDSLEGWATRTRLVGLQIDFDANTQELQGYAGFLRDLRKRLPPKYKLSITGLLDWSANGDPQQLLLLTDVVDEVILQTYQGRETIAGYDKWLDKLDKLPMPFKIGLVQGGEWQAPSSLPKNPNFKGYVIFLLNPKDTKVP